MLITALSLLPWLSGALGSHDSLAKCLYEEGIAKAQDTLWTKANCNEEGGGAIKGLVVDAVCANVADNCPSSTNARSCRASVEVRASGSPGPRMLPPPLCPLESASK